MSFSEQKLNTAVLNRFYIEGGEDSPAEPVSTISTLCRVNTFFEKINYIDHFLKWENNIKFQLLESVNAEVKEIHGVKLFNNLPILPLYLYPICVAREHFLILRVGELMLEKICRTIFHLIA